MNVQRVVILQTDQPKPVYHKIGRIHGPNEWATQCGVRQEWIGWWHGFLQRDHADLFAQPCRRCFR